MTAAAAARIAAWNFIAASDLPVGTKVTVKDGWVAIHPHGGQPVRTAYGPTDTPESLQHALKGAASAATQSPH